MEAEAVRWEAAAAMVVRISSKNDFKLENFSF